MKKMILITGMLVALAGCGGVSRADEWHTESVQHHYVYAPDKNNPGVQVEFEQEDTDAGVKLVPTGRRFFVDSRHRRHEVKLIKRDGDGFEVVYK